MEKISCFQLVTFNPPKTFVPNEKTQLQFEIMLEDFTMYAVDFHEHMESNWWTANIDREETFNLKDDGIRYAFTLPVKINYLEKISSGQTDASMKTGV